MLATIIILLVVVIGILIGLIVYLGRWNKANKENKGDFKKPIKVGLIITAVAVVIFTTMMMLIYVRAKQLPDNSGDKYVTIPRDWSNIAWYSYMAAVVGSIVFCGSIFVFFGAFVLHYYGHFIPMKLDKWLYRTMIISLFAMIVFGFVMLEGYAPYMTYPLISGISFSDGLYNANEGLGGIRWYAIFIIFGAILVYLICDHRIYQKYGSHGTIDGTFIVGLVMGVIGARLFYCVGEWDYYGSHLSEIWRIWDGGLTVLGGVITGIIFGGLWCYWRNHKKYNVLSMVDIIIPTILVAQIWGRWGNFFNIEVYGNEVAVSAWSWLPTIIVNNMRVGADPGMMYVPLFLIEAALNVIGYYLITKIFGQYLRKYIENGDQACMYLVWYGFIRALMEPMRDSHFNMGSDNYWSLIWSLSFMGAGLLLIAINHIIRLSYREKHDTQNFTTHTFKKSWITTLVLSIISFGLIIAGTIMMATNSGEAAVMNADTYTYGIVCLITGISVFLIDIVAILTMIFSIGKRDKITSQARYDLVIFDIDGTLANTDEMVRNSYLYLYDKHNNGIHPPDRELYAFSGPQLRDVLKLEFPADNTEKLAQEFYEYSSTQYDDVTGYDYEIEILKYLKKKDIKIGVYTNKRHELCIKCFEQVGITEYIDYLCGYDDIAERKPSAEGVYKLMRDAGVTDKRKVLYVGDSPVDLKAAQNAGVDFCHCNWGPRVYKDENLAQPYSIQNYRRLKDII